MRNNFFQNLITLGRLVFLRTEKSMANTQNPPQNLMRGRAIIGAGLAILLILTTAACGTLDNPDVIDNGGYGIAPTAAPVTVDPIAVPPTPTESYYSFHIGAIPFTSYYPVGFTEYVEAKIEEGTTPPTLDGSPRIQQDVVVVVLNPSGPGTSAYCTITNEGNDSVPPFGFTTYPVSDKGTVSAASCFQGPRLVRVGENLYQVQVDPYGTVATVSLDDELAQSATPYLFAVGPSGYLGDQASGALTDLLVQGLLTYQGIPQAAENGPVLVEGVVLAPAPVE